MGALNPQPLNPRFGVCRFCRGGGPWVKLSGFGVLGLVSLRSRVLQYLSIPGIDLESAAATASWASDIMIHVLCPIIS